MNLQESPAGLSTNRLEAFSDGVFAIAITLLILGIAVPDGGFSLTSDAFTKSLLLLWPKVASFIISFAIVGIFWYVHHFMFHYIERSDRILVWLNTLCLMTVSFFPFPAEFIGRYPRQQVAIILYEGTFLLMGLSLLAVWICASRHPRIIHPKVDPNFIRWGRWYIPGVPLG